MRRSATKNADYGAIQENINEGIIDDNYHPSQQTHADPEIDDSVDDDLKDLPPEVRDTVPLKDNPAVPHLTWRFFLVLAILVIPVAVVDTVNVFRAVPLGYSIFYVQILAHWFGKKLPYLFPGMDPWTIAETAMVTVTAKSVATGNLATRALALVELYFGVRVPAYAALPFMWSIVFIGYSYASIAKSVVSYDPRFPWPQTLMETALLQSQKDSDVSNDRSFRNPLIVFGLTVASVCLWQILPGYLMPLLSSLSLLCLFSPNKTLRFLGSGLKGCGVLNFTFDWSHISPNIFLYPYWTQIIQFVAFVVGAWILLPIGKANNEFWTNNLYTKDGQIYPVEKLITENGKFNSTEYKKYGSVHLGLERAWSMFFDYAAYLSGISWVLVFSWSSLKQSFLEKRHFQDRLNKLHKEYREIPSSWYVVLFAVSMVSLLVVGKMGYLFMPTKTLFVALLLGSIIVMPLMWLYAISNFQLPLNAINDLLYGYLIENGQMKHPAGAAFFGAIAGNTWYRAQIHLELLKLGFYNHIPPNQVFVAQIWGEFLGVPIGYLTLRYIMDTKKSALLGEAAEANPQWSVAQIAAFYRSAIEHVLLGPKRLFLNYPSLPYGFLLGILAPLVVFCIARLYPNNKPSFEFWNTAVLFSTMSLLYKGNTVGFVSRFLGGTATMFYVFRYKHEIWRSYNYVVAAGVDTGIKLFTVFLALALGIGLTAPTWYGNNPLDPERCFVN